MCVLPGISNFAKLHFIERPCIRRCVRDRAGRGYFVHFNKPRRDLAFEVIIKFPSLKAIRGQQRREWSVDRILFSTIRSFYSTFNEPNCQMPPNASEYTAAIFETSRYTHGSKRRIHIRIRNRWKYIIFSIGKYIHRILKRLEHFFSMQFELQPSTTADGLLTELFALEKVSEDQFSHCVHSVFWYKSIKKCSSVLKSNISPAPAPYCSGRIIARDCDQ